MKREDWGDDWPLIVDSGYAVCMWRDGQRHALFQVRNITYAVNGTASGAKGKYNYRDIEEIWADHPDPYQPKVDITPILRAALALCDEK